MRGSLVAGALLLALGSLAGCGGSHPAAARVDGRAIARSTLLSELAAIRGDATAVSELERQGTVDGPGPSGFAPAFVAQVLDGEVQAAVVHAEVERRGLVAPAGLGANVSAEDPAYASYPASYRAVVAQRTGDRLVLAAALAGTPLSDAALQKAYAGAEADLAEYCVSGLALSTQAEAAAVRAALAGGADLASTARSRSIDPNTRDDGGVLGCGDLGVFPTLGTTVKSLSLKAFSQPVAVGQTWYVVEVTSRTVPSLAQAEPTLVQSLITQYGPFNTFLQQALAAAHVTVAPAYGRFVTTTSPPSVVAPA